MTSAATLETLLGDWRTLLTDWSASGQLTAAAREALQLKAEPELLQKLVRQWSKGDYSGLPPIVLLPSSSMPGAAGAYAISTRTIYLNQDWLRTASRDWVMSVLTEELGHHLDGLLNAVDTSGDEGEIFATLLHCEGMISTRLRQQTNSENDQGVVLVNGEILAIEQATIISTPIRASSPGRTSGEFMNQWAFAALKNDGSVVTWGSGNSGGDSSRIAAQINTGVIQIFSTYGAFAALKSDGSVVTWGFFGSGGDSSAVSAQINSGVRQIFSSGYSFAALKSDGSVVSWGQFDSSAVAGQLASGVSQIFSTNTAFAALKSDGSVVTWGDQLSGGDSNAVAGKLTGSVSQIASNNFAFAALKSDGSVVTWGDQIRGGNSSAVAGQLTAGVSQIFSNNYGAFAALKSDGSVVTWGDSSVGGNSSAVAGQINSGVSQIFSTNSAFAALKSDGSVVTWGDQVYGGNSSAVAGQLTTGVSQIFSNSCAFAALKSNGSVVTWGSQYSGGNSSAVAGRLSSGVSQVFSTGTAFAALKSDGSVVTWGDPNYGGDSGEIAAQINSGVSQIFSTYGAFAALKSDGSVVTWGYLGGGGDSNTVAGRLASDVVGFANPFTDDQLLSDVLLPGVVTLAVSPPSVAEDGAGNLSYTFTRSGSTTNALTVKYTVGGTATNGTDYATIPAAVTFAAGASTATVTVDPKADTIVESDETVEITLASGSGYTIGTTGAVTGTISNDDIALPSVTLAVSPSSVTEDGAANLTYTFTRSAPTTKELTVNYKVVGTAKLVGTSPDPADYTGISTTQTTKTVKFSAGSATATVVVDPTADTRVEGNETVALTLASGTGYTIGTTAAVTGTVTNDDIQSSVSTTLTDTQSSLTLTGSKRINGTGNSLNNTIVGNTNNNRISGLEGKDILTGSGNSDSDIFVYNSLNESLLGAFDVITDFRPRDRIQTPLALAEDAELLTTYKGNASSLTTTAIGAVLTSSSFLANRVGAFTVSGQSGTFIAMNDSRAGFQADSDAIIHLRGYTLSASKFVDFI